MTERDRASLATVVVFCLVSLVSWAIGFEALAMGFGASTLGFALASALSYYRGRRRRNRLDAS